MGLKALGKKVLIEVSAPETVTAGGIIIPESKKESSNKGKVVSVGEEVTSIVEGDFIFFNKFTGAEIEFEKFKYLVLKLEDVHAIVK